MRSLLLTSFILLLLAPSAHAQDTSDYRLRTPTAEEYVEQVNWVLAQVETPYFVDWSASLSYLAEASAMADEINWRFLDRNQMTYDLLNSVYHAFISTERPYQTPPNERWMTALLGLWLIENPTDLSTTDELQFDDYVIEVTRLSASIPNIQNLHGVLWGYLLRVVEGPLFSQGGYIAVVTSENGYIFPVLPAPIKGEILFTGNLNADEYPDVAYLHSTHMGNNYNAGDLLIVSWTGDEFEVISSLHYSESPTGAFPPEAYSWRFFDLDQDDQIELVQNQRLYDNWGCTFIHTTIFDWQTDGALKGETGDNILPQSFNCLLRQAERAMWAHEFAEAIRLYEQAVGEDAEDAELLSFAQTRLGLAYLFAGQTDQAQTTFTNLTVGENSLTQAAKQAYRRDPRLLSVCQEIYNYPDC